MCSDTDPSTGVCWSGTEILISDLATTPDASLTIEHGQYRLRGRFAVQAISGPFQGILSLALRATPIS